MAVLGQLCIKIYALCRDHLFEGILLSYAEENYKNLLRIIGIPAEIKARQLSKFSQKRHRFDNLLSDSILRSSLGLAMTDQGQICIRYLYYIMERKHHL